MENNHIEFIGKDEINPALAVFKFKTSEKIDFKPGQYITIISEVNGKKVLRPYSISSAPYQLPEVDFFIRLVKKDGEFGTFTSKLFNAEIGEKYEILKVGGLFLLDENDKRIKLFVASGTGLGPYISMIREEIKRNGKSDSIVIHGVSHDSDFGYKKELEKYEKEGKIVKYIPTISRPNENPKWNGKIGRAEDLVINELSSILNEKITKEKYAVYACGHPGMIDNIVNYFKKEGFEEKKDIKFERYWSEPKKSL